MSESRHIENNMQPQLAHLDFDQANLLHQDLPRVGTARLAIGAAGAATACIGALVVASIVWFVYAIISLFGTSSADFQDTCPASNLWVSLLVAVISNGLSSLDNMCGNRDKDGKKKTNVVIIVIQMGSVTFSSVEVFRGYAMDNLNGTPYKLQFWLVVITYSIWSLGVIAACRLYAVDCRERDEERRRHNVRASIIQQFDDININLEKSKAAQWHRNKLCPNS
jgi:hypothetical protein